MAFRPYHCRFRDLVGHSECLALRRPCTFDESPAQVDGLSMFRAMKLEEEEEKKISFAILNLIILVFVAREIYQMVK